MSAGTLISVSFPDLFFNMEILTQMFARKGKSRFCVPESYWVWDCELKLESKRSADMFSAPCLQESCN